MKDRKLIGLLTAAVILGSTANATQAADEPSASPSRPTPSLGEQLRERLRHLPPDQRRARLQELRQRRAQGRQQAQQLTPEQRRQRLDQLRQRAEARLAELRAKQQAGTLTPQETEQLRRLETRLHQLEQRRHLRDRQPRPPAGPDTPPGQPRR